MLSRWQTAGTKRYHNFRPYFGLAGSGQRERRAVAIHQAQALARVVEADGGY